MRALNFAAWIGVALTGSALAQAPRHSLALFSERVALAEARNAQEVREGRLLFDTRDARLRKGEVVVDPAIRGMAIEGALVHHRRAIAFAPGATFTEAIAIAKDYDSFSRIYAPFVTKSKLISRDGDRAKFELQVARKKAGISALINIQHDLDYRQIAPGRGISRVHAVRIAEVSDAGSASERESREDHGFLWALESWWRFVEQDGGVYVQVESLSLSREAPLGLNWLLGRFLESVHQEFLLDMVAGTRRALVEKLAR
jgi:hypothetical protein